MHKIDDNGSEAIYNISIKKQKKKKIVQKMVFLNFFDSIIFLSIVTRNQNRFLLS